MVSDRLTLQVKFPPYHTREIFGRGKFWQTMKVKAIGEVKFDEQATVSA